MPLLQQLLRLYYVLQFPAHGPSQLVFHVLIGLSLIVLLDIYPKPMRLNVVIASDRDAFRVLVAVRLLQSAVSLTWQPCQRHCASLDIRVLLLHHAEPVIQPHLVGIRDSEGVHTASVTADL